MRKARVLVHKTEAGILDEILPGSSYRFTYHSDYQGPPVSLTMPIQQKEYLFAKFPPFFEGLLPEGPQLEGLLRQRKLDANDYFSQIVAVGSDLVGAVSIFEVSDE
jgi:serine/threonine-protein kinase HipA